MAIALFGLSSMVVQPHEVTAQTSYGGLCCTNLDTPCDHPIGLTFADSIWVSGSSTCTIDEEGEVKIYGHSLLLRASFITIY